MKKKVRNSLITILFLAIIIGVAVLIIWSKSANAGAGVTPELAQCIGSHSAVYIQAGCHFCAVQENLFGENWQYLNATDCYYNPQACNVIVQDGFYSTPTWIINGQLYPGVQSIAKLKQLTGC